MSALLAASVNVTPVALCIHHVCTCLISSPVMFVHSEDAVEALLRRPLLMPIWSWFLLLPAPPPLPPPPPPLLLPPPAVRIYGKARAAYFFCCRHFLVLNVLAWIMLSLSSREL
jgi:hypothetical protein